MNRRAARLLIILLACALLLQRAGARYEVLAAGGDPRREILRERNLGQDSAGQTSGGTTTRVSVASDGTQADLSSDKPSISADGRYVAFRSSANNLVSGDINDYPEVFVHDRRTGQTTLVSVASDGTPGNSFSDELSISADGRYVAFQSESTNLVNGDTNDEPDIFVHDRQTGQTERVSVASDGTQAILVSHYPFISANGRYIGFSSGTSNLVSGDVNDSWDIFVHDRQTGQTELVSVASDETQGNAESFEGSISADGRYVAFDSQADNLVSGDINNEGDIFVHDRQTGQTELLSMASDGTQGNSYSFGASISADGRYVAFVSDASNLVNGDTNNDWDVFVHDRQTGHTEIVSVASDGTRADRGSINPAISADGRYVVFESGADNLVSEDLNQVGGIFVHDRQTRQTEFVSVASDGTLPDNGSGDAAISADGRFVAFYSLADNLVAGDTNRWEDVFVRDRGERYHNYVSIFVLTP